MPWESFDLGRRDDTSELGAVAVGRLVRSRREALGLSQRALADRVLIDQSVISRLENGRLPGMRWSRFIWLIGMLGGLERTRCPSGCFAADTDEGSTRRSAVAGAALMHPKGITHGG